MAEGRWSLSSAPGLLRPPHLSAQEAATATVPLPACGPCPFLRGAGAGGEEASERWCCTGAVTGGDGLPRGLTSPRHRPPKPRGGTPTSCRREGAGGAGSTAGTQEADPGALRAAKQESGSVRGRKSAGEKQGVGGRNTARGCWCLERERPGEKPPELTDRTGSPGGTARVSRSSRGRLQGHTTESRGALLGGGWGLSKAQNSGV